MAKAITAPAVKKKPTFPKLDAKTKQVLAKFVKVARYSRNFGLAKNLDAVQLRVAGVEAEVELENVFGTKVANELTILAFKP